MTGTERSAKRVAFGRILGGSQRAILPFFGRECLICRMRVGRARDRLHAKRKTRKNERNQNQWDDVPSIGHEHDTEHDECKTPKAHG
jgi:hypothetical protein